MALADYLTVNDETVASRALATAFAGDGRVLHGEFEQRLLACGPTGAWILL
jgi:hypothetical protein